MFYLTGVQRTKNQDEVQYSVIPVLGYETVDEYKLKYHQEMTYAMGMDNFIGLDILVFDENGAVLLNDNWVKEGIEPEPEPES